MLEKVMLNFNTYYERKHIMYTSIFINGLEMDNSEAILAEQS